MRLLPIICCALLLGGCTTNPKTYKPPNDAKVKAATADLTVKVDRARETARRAKTTTEEAAASAQRLIALAKTTDDKITLLRNKLPPEHRPLVDDVKASFDAQTTEEGVARDRANSAVAWNLQLETQLSSAETARATLQREVDSYAGGAAALAQSATEERNYRIAAEKQLLRQKIFGWLWKLGGGAVILVVLGLIFLWWSGKLAIKLAR